MSRSCTPAGRPTVAAGFFGELHPLVAEAFGIEVPVAVFELGLDGAARAPPGRCCTAT